MFETPVAIIIFRRPDLTRRVLEVLAQVQPKKLMIIADGARPDRPGEAEACAAARAAAECITWDCEVLKNYSDVNLGCGPRPASGISWVFDQVEEAIILEDDCVPHPSFFQFCSELLALYRNDERVMHINGSTYRHEPAKVAHSYYFSQFIGCWGWATWRRAWKQFDYSVQLWPEFRENGWLEALVDNNEAAMRYWSDKFQRAYERQPGLTYWDYQWAFACWAFSGLGIVPAHNLISNIGCGNDATHTFDHPHGNVPAQPMPFPLRHPSMILHDWKLDREFLHEVILASITEKPIPPLKRLRRAISQITPQIIKKLYRAQLMGRRRSVSAIPE